MDGYRPIGELLRRVRTRWQIGRVFDAIVRVALASSGVLLLALALAYWAEQSTVALTVWGSLSLLTILVAVFWGLMPLRRRPSDLQLARFIEERAPLLDDRLVTAVDFYTSRPSSPNESSDSDRNESPLAILMIADVGARVSAIEPESIVGADRLRRAAVRATASALAALILLGLAGRPARLAIDATAFVLFPSHVGLDVQPGGARIRSGASLSITARLVGTLAPMPANVQIADGDLWRTVAMKQISADSFRLALESVTVPFRYRVVAGILTSPTYDVRVAQAPRVSRIDLDYAYPPTLNLAPRSEEDGGDIYAPAETAVRLRIHTDSPVASGRLTLGHGESVPLQTEAPTLLSASLKVVDDNSYRVALADGDGFSNPGDTEYFIRALDDRPPEVHITKPAGDRSVTRLQEVEIEVQADDDYGIDRLELVYSVRGGSEQVVPLDVPRHASSVSARHMLYLEDLEVQPGDFVSYYVRARDLTRTTRSNAARSDLFFLDVRPFEQEFSLAQSQSMAGSGYSGTIDELVNGQRQVTVATWKLDRRAADAKGGRSERDIRSVARTEADLKQRVERTASSFRESTMRDPRKRLPGGAGITDPPRPEEDAMAAAARAMDKAVVSLDALQTAEALPPEMEALNQLLRAQAEIRHRQVSLNQSAAGAGNANRNFDISTLFDQELRRQQQTNYETSKSPERRRDGESDALDGIKELARRQDELLRRQQELAQLPVEERNRRLEQLTREQSDLRQRAEELAQQMSKLRNGAPSNDENARMRDISEDMRQAAGDLRRGDQAGSSARRALERLRDLEKRMQPSTPDEERRILGELQLQARQLADRQRQLASALAALERGDASKDDLRRLAGDQERLVEQVRQLGDRLKQAAATSDRSKDGQRRAQAVRQAVRELEQRRLSERLEESADRLLAAAGGSTRGIPAPAGGDPRAQAGIQAGLADPLDRLADRLAEAGGVNKGDESRRLSERLARTQELRDKLDRLGGAFETAGRRRGAAATDSSARKAPGDRGQTGEGRRGAGGIDLTKLSEESLRELREVRDFVDQLRREDPSFAKSGAGFTFEGQGMVMSAPGTEAFKQDFAKWDLLRQQAIVALEQAESALSKMVRAADSEGRLVSGPEDKAPAEYQTQVDKYFKAIAGGKR